MPIVIDPYRFVTPGGGGAARQAVVAAFPQPICVNTSGTREAVVAGPVAVNEG